MSLHRYVGGDSAQISRKLSTDSLCISDSKRSSKNAKKSMTR